MDLDLDLDPELDPAKVPQNEGGSAWEDALLKGGGGVMYAPRQCAMGREWIAAAREYAGDVFFWLNLS